MHYVNYAKITRFALLFRFTLNIFGTITGCACSCLFLLSPISTENVGERERARFSAENSESGY
ncbi:hypothetical protein DERF_005517 [Dermatophagoides farinae]|uniref:Uncharacterized protein n=1 Tax=Dermatophagoides farinae TaxID=6954 RepID=A0A922I5T0_DERFA|nr:hypothetical protein DERF_005517 [Dermatophagoides farinae]